MDESQTLSGDAIASLETPRTDEIHSDGLLAMSEEELNAQITHARTEARLKRKRDYIAAIQRGETTDIDPYEFDEPENRRTPAAPERRVRREGPKIQLPPLKYKGSSYAEMQNFTFDLENRFLMFSDDFKNDTDRVIYATNSMIDTQKTRWRTHVGIHYHHNLSLVTWDGMKDWLREGISDDDTRSLEAVMRLHTFFQQPNDSFNTFLDKYEHIENEMPFELPPKYLAISLLRAMNPDLRKQVVSMGVPEDRQAVISAARRSESLLRNSQPHGTGNANRDRRNQRSAPTLSSNTSSGPEPTSQGTTSDVTETARDQTEQPTPQNSKTCFKCGEQGHYANRCPQNRCSRCAGFHRGNRCPDTDNPNNLPVARHVAPKP